jgi:hypothetical protein
MVAVTEGGSFPVGGTIAIVGGSVVAVGGAVFCYMRRREVGSPACSQLCLTCDCRAAQNKMKSDIDSLLRQYLPLDGGVGINSQARETAAAEAHRKCVIFSFGSQLLIHSCLCRAAWSILRRSTQRRGLERPSGFALCELHGSEGCGQK